MIVQDILTSHFRDVVVTVVVLLYHQVIQLHVISGHAGHPARAMVLLRNTKTHRGHASRSERNKHNGDNGRCYKFIPLQTYN